MIDDRLLPEMMTRLNYTTSYYRINRMIFHKHVFFLRHTFSITHDLHIFRFLLIYSKNKKKFAKVRNK